MKKKLLLFCLSLVQLVGVMGQANLSVSAPQNNGSTTGLRAPNGTAAQTTIRAHFIIPASELTALPNGTVVTTVGYLLSAGAVGTPAGNIQFYLENTVDATNLKSTTWATAISTMTSVYNGTYTIPSAVGSVDLTMSSTFTYTGGALYVAYDYLGTSFAATGAVYLANNTLASSCFTGVTATATPAVTLGAGASSFRPEIRFGFPNPYTNDVTVSGLVADKGKINSLLQNTTTVNATITNSSSVALTNIPVTLDITGANPYNSIQTITSLAAGASENLLFSGIPVNALGTQTIDLSVPADDQNANNSLTYLQDIYCDTVGFTNNTPSISGIGYDTGAGILANQFDFPAGLPLNVKTVSVTLTPSVDNTNNTIKGVLLNDLGTILDSTALFTITAADLGAKVNLDFINGSVDYAGESVYIGFRQTANTTTGYFPCGTQTPTIVLDSTHYGFGENGGAATLYTTLGAFMIDAVVQAPDLTVTSNATNGTMCVATPLSLTAAPIGYDNYDFNVDAASAQSSSSNVYAYTIANSSTYFVTAIKNACSFNTTAITITGVTELNTSIDAGICPGDSYVFGTQTLTVGGTYADTLTSIGGCDSISTLNLALNQPTSSTISNSICDGETFVFGTQNLTAAGTYTNTIPNVAGCDSVITLNLTVNQPSSSTYAQSICQGDTFVFGGQNLTAAGTYTDTIPNAVGCDSVITLTLSITPLDLTVTQNGATLTSNAATATILYQWIDCANNSPIAGATNASFTPTNNGNYAVIVIQGTCSDTSLCSLVDFTGIDEIDLLTAISIFPNPAQEVINIESKLVDLAAYTVFDIEGRVILNKTVLQGVNFVSIATEALESGTYIIEIESENATARKVFVKE